jgi:predicted MFS family arabinose efflux permease
MQSAQDSEAPYSRGYLRYALALLTTVYAFNFIDRQILVILQESIKREMGLSDAALGVLSGFSFAIFYVTAGLPIARLADRGVRRNVVALSLTTWSFMTAVSGLVRNYWQLVAARIGVGIGEAGGSPPAHAILSDYFPPAERGRALSIYSGGIYIGILFGFLAGGWVSQVFGWRTAFFVAGAPGLLLAVLVRLTLREPRRGRSEGRSAAEPQLPLRQSLELFWRLSAFRYVALGTAFTAFAAYSTGNFAASFLARSYHLAPGEVGSVLALVIGIGGLIGTVGGGYLSDRLALGDRRWQLWVPAISIGLALPLQVLAYTATDLRLCIGLWMSAIILQTTYLGPSIAVCHSLVAPSLRAFTSSVLFLVLNLIGLGAGPLLTGIISDRLSPLYGAESLRWAMVLVCLVYIPAVAMYFLAAARLGRSPAELPSR